MMRVIAGSARRIQLRTIEGMDTRPTTDRIKETLFNMMQYDVADACFLDLFSGSGAIGIEALSRGAGQAVFIEQNAAAVSCIRENLKVTRLEDRAMIMACDAVAGLKRLEGKELCFDIVFMDPPYQKELERAVLELLSSSELIHEDTVLIVEAALETEFSYVSELGYCIMKRKEYKTNQHVFLQKES